MITIDPTSVLIAVTPTALCMPLLLWPLIRGMARPSVSLWYFGLFCFGLALVFDALHQALPYWLSDEGSEVLTVVCVTCLWVAQRVELDRRPRVAAGLVVVGLVLLVYFVLKKSAPLYAQQAFVNGSYALVELYILRDAQRLRTLWPSVSAMLIVVGWAMAIAANLIRVVAVASGNYDESQEVNLADALLVAGLMTASVLLNFGFFGYILDVENRKKRDLEVTQARTSLERDNTKLLALELEKTLAERDKMLRISAHMNRVATLDSITSGVAHEINQPLAAARLNLELLQTQLKGLSPGVPAPGELVAEAHREVTRAAEIVRRIRALVRNRDISLVNIDLSRQVDVALELTEAEAVRHTVTIHRAQPVPTMRILGDPVLVQQVILNVLSNAIDALSVSATDKRHISISHESADRRHTVVIEDSGPGIAAEMRSHIFEALATTKPTGIGLGLAICKSIMDRLDGTIQLSKSLLGGVRVDISFPSSDGQRIGQHGTVGVGTGNPAWNPTN